MSINSTCAQPEFICSDVGIILPLVNESIWSAEFRVVLYLVGLLWSFMAIALVADAFMCAIEVITSQTTEIKVARPEKEEGYEIVQVRIWNDTVANLTLMALGSSAPEILLSIIEILGNNFYAGALGPGTIVGSASFNLLIIIAVCVVGIPDGEFRKIKRMKVFATTAISSLFAYVWLYIVLLVVSPNKIEIWEATVTFAFFPILVILAFIADKDYCGKKKVTTQMEIEMGNAGEDANLVYTAKTEEDKMKNIVQTFMKTLDKPEIISEEDASNLAALKMQEEQQHSRAWFRVQASRNLLGGKRIDPYLSENLQKKMVTSTPLFSVPLSVIELSKAQAANIFQDALLVGLVFIHNTLLIKTGQLTNVKKKNLIHDVVSYENGSLSTPTHKVGLDGFLEKPTSQIEFDAVSCSVMENCGTVKLNVVRTGDLSKEVYVKYETVDGTACAGSDYVAKSGILTFKPQELKMFIEIEIIDDNVWEPDETFFVKLFLPEDSSLEGGYLSLGKKLINQITIINDDEPGTIEFSKPSYLVKESVGTAYIPLQRTNGADGTVIVEWKTEDLSGKAGVHYAGRSGQVIFEHGEDSKNINIQIINDHATKKDESFQISLLSVSEGAKLGRSQKTVVSIVGDDEFDALVRRVVAKTHLKLLKMKLGSQSWSEQYVQAMSVNGGDIENARAADYVMHFLTFGFKVIVAIVPPPNIWNGWACFFGALTLLIGLTAIVGDLASIFGCLIDLEPSVTAITFVALGTSLPDLYASKTAALQEKYADNSIGNVTGSNSVNVFLGLGLPWLIASIYWNLKTGQPFDVEANSLGFSVALYSISALLCILTLVMRRHLKALGGSELGGPKKSKMITGGFFVLLWFLYIILSALQAYNVIPGF